MHNRIVKYILFIMTLFFIQCKSIEIPEYNKIEKIQGNTEITKSITDKIDKGTTYAVTFSLKGNEKCIKLGINTTVFEESIEKNINIKNYFIIEKKIDLSDFPAIDTKNYYSEIARNFDYNWSTKPEIELCSTSNPIEKLNKDSELRVRFTTFDKRNFEYIINIYTENGITN